MITLIGAFEKFDQFKDGECMLKFSIPRSHRLQASEVAHLIEMALIIQVYQPHEVAGKQDEAE